MVDFANFISRRRIVVDIGACDIKVILVERYAKRIRVIESRLIDFADGGFMTQDESSVELQQVLESLGEYPIVLIIPEHLSLARLTQFSLGPRRELTPENLRELSGWFHLGDDEEILWELRHIRKIPGYVNAGILTMARAMDVDDQVQRLGLYETNLIRVTTPASALAEAFFRMGPPGISALLLEVGATTTAVVVIESGQVVYSTSFPIGGESLTEVIAGYFDISFDEAELRKREERFFIDEELTPVPLKAAVESWLNELYSVLEIQFGEAEYVNEELRRRPIYLSGGGAQIPGMVDYLRHIYSFRLETWDEMIASFDLDEHVDPHRFLGAIGAGWTACQRQSLMPAHLKQTRTVQTVQFFANILSFILICSVLVFLVVCSAREFQHFSELSTGLDTMERSFARVQTIDTLMLERYYRFKQHRLLLERYQRSLDWSRSADAFNDFPWDSKEWLIMLADKERYFSATRQLQTNSLAEPTLDSLAIPSIQSTPAALTRLEQPGIVAQIVIDGPIESALNHLSGMVEKLKNIPPFENVDRLPVESLDSLVPAEFALTNQTFTLRLDWKGYQRFEFPPAWTNRFTVKLPGKGKSTNDIRALPPGGIRTIQP